MSQVKKTGWISDEVHSFGAVHAASCTSGLKVLKPFLRLLGSSLEGGQSRGKNEWMLYVHMSIQCLSLTGEPHVSGEAVRLAPPCGPDTATKFLPFFLPLPLRSICSGFQLCKVFTLHFSSVSQSLAPTEPRIEA